MKKHYDSLEELIKNNLNNEEELQTAELINKLSQAKERGYCNQAEFMDICMWKSARPKKLYLENSEEDIMKITKEAFVTKYEKRKIDLLTELKGVSIPTASAILTLVYPEDYGVIDIRVWQILYLYGSVKDNPKGVGMDFKNWYNYLMKLRYFAKKFKVTARDIERTIFYHHKNIQEKSLYS